MLGTDLFVRSSRQVELTPAGRALLEEAPLALAALERDCPNLTVVASEPFSAEIPGRVLPGELDVRVAAFPETMRGIGGDQRPAADDDGCSSRGR